MREWLSVQMTVQKVDVQPCLQVNIDLYSVGQVTFLK